MGQHDSLGRPGGSAGVQDGGHAVGVDLCDRCLGMAARHQVAPPVHLRIGGDRRNLAAAGDPEAEPLEWRQVIGDAGEDQGLKRSAVAHLGEATVERVQRQGESRPADLEVELDLRRGGQRVNHRGHRTQPDRGVERDHTLRAGRHGDGDPVSLAEPQRRQGRSAFSDRRAKLPVGRAVSQKLIGNRIGYPAHRVHHHLIEAARRVVERGGDAAVEAEPGE